ncbi:MAG: hypothetical protein ABJ275_05225 [Maricaulaceae bacterium]
MTEEKVDLHWTKFTWHLTISIIAFACAFFADTHIFTTAPETPPLINNNLDTFMGAVLIMGTFAFALWSVRVPYRKDMFERRLRNWSMTTATMIMFVMTISINIAYQGQNQGAFLITPHLMPALWLICYILYSQYTRYCIVHGRRNSFLDGNDC